MADEQNGAQQPGDGAENAAPPQISINAQYIKDLSFENPNAPASFTQSEGQPQVQIQVDVQVRPGGSNTYEVALHLTVDAKRGDNQVFILELVYAAIFTLQNIPEENHELICLVECPRLIFPFARRIVADMSRDGGFPPLMMDPIDFMALYQSQRARQQEAQQQTEGGNA